MRQNLKETSIVVISGMVLGGFLQVVWAEKRLDEFWSYGLLLLSAVGIVLYYYVWQLYAYVLSKVFSADLGDTLRGDAHTYLPTALLCLYFPFRTPEAKLIVVGAALAGIVLLKLLYIRRSFRGAQRTAVGAILDMKILPSLVVVVLVGLFGLRVFKVLNLESAANRYHVQYLKSAEIGDEVRLAIGGEFPNNLEKRVVVPERATLEFGVGVSEKLWRRLRFALGFNLYVEEQPGWLKRVLFPASSTYKRHLVFSETLDPARREEDRTWRDTSVDLAAYSGKTIDLVFQIDLQQATGGSQERATGRSAQAISKDDFRGLLRLRGALWSEPRIYSHSPHGPEVNVLLLTADALRADHLSCYGYGHATSPAIDRLARSGVRFANAFSQTNSTTPSLSSIFTSTHVQTHGVLRVVGFLLSDSFVTLAEMLKAREFKTSGVTSVYHLNPRSTGLGQGFDSYFIVEFMQGAREANEVALRWLEQNQGHRFFLWIHYFDPHIPYDPPPPFDRLFPRENAVRNETRTSEGWDAGARENVRSTEPASPEDAAERVALYDGEIRYMDEEIGLLIKKLENLGLRERTLVVFTADHGESLTEHGIYFDHRGLYDQSIHVPLIMAYPGRLPEGKVVEALVQSIDIMPTILDILDIPAEQQMEGKSLLPLIYGRAGELHSEVYIEPAHSGDVGLALRTRKWKLIYPLNPSVTLGSVPKLFDLENDPGEITNLAKAEPEVLEELTEKVLKWRAAADRTEAERVKLGEEDKEKLRTLGYLQ